MRRQVLNSLDNQAGFPSDIIGRVECEEGALRGVDTECGGHNIGCNDTVNVAIGSDMNEGEIRGTTQGSDWDIII